MVRPIVIDPELEKLSPMVRLTTHHFGNIWEYAGANLLRVSNATRRSAQPGDLNVAMQIAAGLLADKVAGRCIQVKIIIDPLIPLIFPDVDQLVPVILAIAENASASVEPGPGTVILRSFWREQHAGVDAVGRGGFLPAEIRENLMRPCFSTRVAEWDTGFGLFGANEAASLFKGKVEVFEPEGGVGFRVIIPIGAKNVSPPEMELGVDEGPGEAYSPTVSKLFEVLNCIAEEGSANEREQGTYEV